MASVVSRKLGAAAIASHGVVLKVWLMFVLAAEAPAVAGQVIAARYLATGRRARAARVFRRLLKVTLGVGVATAAGLCAAAGPASRAFFPADPAAAAATTRLFAWAALSVPLVWPRAGTERRGAFEIAFSSCDSPGPTEGGNRTSRSSGPTERSVGSQVWPNALCEAVLLGAGRYT